MDQSPKYYLYVSDTKIDMLFNQIPPKSLAEYSRELKIDLKVLGVSIGKTPSAQSVYEKVKTVSRFLSKNNKIGTVTDPLEYFSGTLPMRWGLLGTRLAYFSGIDGDTILGLGGSSYNVIGEKKDLEIPVQGFGSTSSAAAIIREISSITLEESKLEFSELNFRLLSDAIRELKGPIQKCKFLAKKLVRKFDRHKNLYLLLGSPLYVTLAE